VLEEKSGKDFTDFFNQWYFGEGYPVFNIGGVQNNDSLVITSQQTKSILTAPLFKMPFMLQLKYAGGDTTLNLYQMHVTERFVIPFKKKVTSIVFDPKNWLLAKAYTRVTDVEESEPAKEITFGLSQNYPNPFNPSTTIQYNIPDEQLITVKVYDVLGNVVQVIKNERQKPGTYSAVWDAKNHSSGIYFIELAAGSYRAVKKVTLLK
ncbi:MAG: T9SS type A sorting domain-containing protein, partial [Bacteroidota bacterium]|nr:T9SS type A sorting domain-containing protein [Bacteroidota bacterium]